MLPSLTGVHRSSPPSFAGYAEQRGAAAAAAPVGSMADIGSGANGLHKLVVPQYVEAAVGRARDGDIRRCNDGQICLQ